MLQASSAPKASQESLASALTAFLAYDERACAAVEAQREHEPLNLERMSAGCGERTRGPGPSFPTLPATLE